MLHIQKKRPSAEFRKAQQEYGHYDDLPGDRKNQLKQILIEEQDSLCAYCMVRIGMTDSSIEHYIPRKGENGDPSLSLDYKNLLAVCENGHHENNSQCRHCDVTRGNKPLTVDPRKAAHIRTITYKADGTICSTDEKINDDLNSEKRLNLNHPALKDARKATVERVKLEIYKRHHGQWSKELIRKYLDYYKGASPKISYAGIVIYELEKRLKRG